MVESVRIALARLFEVRVLHHFWLDEGGTVFDALPADEQVERLLTYDARQVVQIAPDAATSAAIAGLGGVFRATGVGCLVAVPEDVRVPLGTEFVFHVTTRDPEYTRYTALTLRDQPIADVVDPADPRTAHRYRAGVPTLSNLTGASRGAGQAKRLYLSREYPTGAGDGVEALVLSGSTVRQLTGDPPAAPVRALGTKGALPVFLHQGDVLPITAPPGSTGAPAAGIELSPDTPPTVVAVLRLAPRRPDDDAFSFVEADGAPRTPTRVFQVHLLNRATVRRYRDRRAGTVIETEPAPLPLTHFGNAGAKQQPSPLDVVAETDAADRITALVSDIYV
jgi:hypothetical protein